MPPNLPAAPARPFVAVLTAPVTEPDAHGQAALLLAESILHALVARGALSNAEAVEAVRVAAEVKLEVATAQGESAKRMEESLGLLHRMTASFEADDTRHPPEARAPRPA